MVLKDIVRIQSNIVNGQQALEDTNSDSVEPNNCYEKKNYQKALQYLGLIIQSN